MYMERQDVKIKGKNMFEKFEIHGRWFLPNQEVEEGISGTLYYSPERITLNLDGIFEDEEDTNSPSFRSFDGAMPEKIYGFSRKGERLTLFGCHQTNVQRNHPGYGVSTFNIDSFISGRQYIQNEEEGVFNEVAFSTNHLNQWFETNPYDVEYTQEEGGSDYIERLTIDTPTLKKNLMEYPVSSKNMVIKESFTKNSHHDLKQKNTLHYSFEYFFRSIFESTKKQSLKSIQTTISSFRNLLTFLVGKPLHFSVVTLYMEDIKPAGDDGKRIPDKYHWFFRQIGETKTQKKPQFIFSYRELKDNFGNILNMWFEKEEDMKLITDAHVGQLYLPTYLENQFLESIRNLESYHRIFYEDKKSLQKEKKEGKQDESLNHYKEQIKRFIEKHIENEQDRLYFEERIDYTSETDLRSRIKYLIEHLPESLQEKIILGREDKDVFLTEVIHTRNYWTHGDKTKRYKKRITDASKLFYTNEKLRILLEFYLFKEIGVPGKEIEEKLLDHYAYILDRY